MPLGDELRSKFGSEKNISMASWNFGHVFAVGEKKITTNGMWVEANFPSMFTLRMLKGNINGLTDPSAIMINASLEDIVWRGRPVNKTIKLDNKIDFKVAGVFEDFLNTSLNDTKILLPWKKYITDQWLKDAATQWNNHSWHLPR